MDSAQNEIMKTMLKKFLPGNDLVENGDYFDWAENAPKPEEVFAAIVKAAGKYPEDLEFDEPGDDVEPEAI